MYIAYNLTKVQNIKRENVVLLFGTKSSHVPPPSLRTYIKQKTCSTTYTILTVPSRHICDFTFG